MRHNLIETLYGSRLPTAVAIREPGGTCMTTADLLDRVGRFAAALQHLGVRPGDRVSFKLEKSIDVVALAHACFWIGAIAHPLNTGYTLAETEYLLRDAAPVLVVCEPEQLPLLGPIVQAIGAALETLGGGGGSLASFAVKARQTDPALPVAADHVAALLYTSGTTGKPKGAEITHGNLAQSARALIEVWKVGVSDVLLHALPVYHAHGLLTSLNVLLAGGGAINFLPRFHAGEVSSGLHNSTVMMGVPTHYARLLETPGFADAIPPQFRLFISGSAPLSADLASRFLAHTGHTILERYGATETAIVTAIPAGTTDRSGWVGWPLPGVEIRLAEPTETGARSDTDNAVVGVLETRGHNVFKGYWQHPEANTDAFTIDGWFNTGDLAEIDVNGCVRLLGRTKDLIISGGLNVYPLEVESILDAIDGVTESAVFGVPHPDFGEAVVAAVIADDSFDETSLIAAARIAIAGFKTPKRIVRVDEIPKNRMGKVLKADLRARFASLCTRTPISLSAKEEKKP